jgi:hypothetical protein
MHKKINGMAFLLAVTLLLSPAAETARKGSGATVIKGEITGNEPSVLWRNPTDIASRNLFFGSGGKAHQPQGPFTFLKEDTSGTNPKFEVRDSEGVEWKVKLGEEARPETVASRLVWAVGYFTNEDYFLADLRVGNMPTHLKRGQNLIGPDGLMHNVRLKRHLIGQKKIGSWQWRQNPFIQTRELNGLRVMMALINNWDLKDQNNALYEEKRDGDSSGPERIFMVSDLGASFGTTGRGRSHAISKGNLKSYTHSKFISKVTPSYVDFSAPSRPSLLLLFSPAEFVSRLRLRKIGKRVPRTDVRWMGHLLAQLSPEQVRDAFRAAGYTPQEVEGFTRVVEERITALNKL